MTLDVPSLLTPARIAQAGAELVKIGVRTKRTAAVLAGNAGPANAAFIKAAEKLGSYAGESMGRTAGQLTANAFGASVVIGGKVTVPLLTAGLVCASTLWRTGKHAYNRQWKMAAAEFGVGMVEASINIALLPMPALGLLLGEAARQGLVEIVDRKFGVRPENAGFYNLYKTVHHGVKLHKERRAKKREAMAKIPRSQNFFGQHLVPF